MRTRISRRGRRQPAIDDPPPEQADGRSVADLVIAQRCAPYTLTSPSRVQALLDAVAYCVQRRVEGAFVECGVWRGGSVLAMVSKLLELGERDRPIVMYDTFEGMTEPSELDTSPFGPPALETWRSDQAEGRMPWEHLFDETARDAGAVSQLLRSAGYPEEQLHFVVGKVEDTLPDAAPDRIALLRLDTDWYESTAHELLHLYPRLVPGGVLIIDDYGHWEGCRRAVDEYFSTHAAPLLLNRIDYTGRVAVKI